MVGSSKILTVSYGTFSCTLEGFEDSFETMKAIAEYFRDLAADDRYFGAEPPTPDAEMLARIAEREIARRVEASTVGTGIVLRAMETATPASLANQPAARPQPEVTAGSEAEETAAEEAPASAIRPDEEVAEPSPPPMADLGEPATELDDIGDAVEAVAAATGAPTGDDPSPLLADEAPVPPLRMPPAVTARNAARPQHIAPEAVPHHGQRPAPLPVEPPAHPDADSVAAKLQRIRAVVGRGTTPLAAGTLAATEEDASADIPGLADILFEPEAAEPAAEEARPDAVLTAVEEQPETEADLPHETEDDLETAAEMAAVPDETAEPLDDMADTAETMDAPADEAAPQPVRARVIRMSRAEFEAALASGQVDAVDEDDDDYDDFEIEDEDEDDLAEEERAFDAADLDDLARLDVSPEDFAEGSLSPEDEADLLEELAAVEAEMADNDDDLAEGIDEVDGTDDRMTRSDADLVEDEDDLQDAWTDEAPEAAEEDADPEDRAADAARDDDAILAGLMAREASGSDAPDTTDDNSDNLFAGSEDGPEDPEAEAAADAALAATLRRVGPRRVVLEEAPEADEAAMSRLLSHANERLVDPELERKRQSIAQLKAAVAATEAARKLGEETAEDTRPDHAFRDDLERVVRPRRPVPATEMRSERPRPAPLKLVPAQRVDIPAPATTTRAEPVVPVRPRRVSVDTIAPATAEAVRDAGSFAEFARSMGATGLNDLLEAAAAYTAYVEGMEEFSRPQLLNKVRAAATDDFSREDGLRSFGTLLRQGRLTKLRNGRFQISADTRFHPERRAG